VYASAQEKHLLRSDFKLRADRFADAIKADLASYAEVMRSIADALEVDEALDRAAFHRLVARPLERHPGIAALSWNPLVLARDRAAFEAQARRSGPDDFAIVERGPGGGVSPARPRPAYVPVLFIEPAARNRRAVGFDLTSDPVRREAVERARRTGEVAISAPLELVQDALAQPAVLLLSPVVRDRASHPEEVQGFAVAVLRILDVVEASLRAFDLSGIDLQLRDASTAPGQRLCSLRSGAPADLELAGEFEVEDGFELGGRRWELRFAPSPAFASTHRSWQAWTVFALGLLFTSLLGAFLLVVTGRAASVDQLVEQQTRQLTQSLREQEVLIKEVHHRVKNNLQVISSLINMQARELGDSERAGERNALRECQSRVQAIALVHEKLYQTGRYAEVPFSSYARSLADNVFEANGVSRSAIALRVAIDEIDLSVDKAVPCALILNELISNALKHAFATGRRGTIRVELSRVDAGACLVVADDGQGLTEGVDPMQGKSLGMKLVSTLTRQLQGTLDIASGAGVTVRVTFPI
jgi:two-component sensor histidine kinase/CHASE1-domain containing sensor protein